MLSNDDFIAWTNENAVAEVGHDGATGGKEDHKPVDETDPKTKEKRSVCPSYTGLTCEEHRKCRADASSGADGLPKIGQADGVPNSWIILPDGTVEKFDQAKSMSPKDAIEELTKYQKNVQGKPVGSKKYEVYRKAFADGDKAVEDAKWKVALAAYLKVDADAKKLSTALEEKVKAKLATANEKVAAKFTELKDGDGDAATKLKTIKALRADVGTKFTSGFLASVADMDAWIKDAAAAAAPAKAPAK